MIIVFGVVMAIICILCVTWLKKHSKGFGWRLYMYIMTVICLVGFGVLFFVRRGMAEYIDVDVIRAYHMSYSVSESGYTVSETGEYTFYYLDSGEQKSITVEHAYDLNTYGQEDGEQEMTTSGSLMLMENVNGMIVDRPFNEGIIMVHRQKIPWITSFLYFLDSERYVVYYSSR